MAASPEVTAQHPQPFELTPSQKLLTLLGVLLGMLLAALDQTIVSTAGPAIQKDLHIPASLYAWITTSYLVASTVLVPVYGKLSDAFGRRRILVIGIVIFLLGSALCGLSQTTLQLILARALQGVGSASLFTSAFAIVADIFPPSERGKYQGIFGAVFGLSSVVGPLVGGFLTDHLSWHWVFFVNLPVGAVALGFILTRMPPLRHAGRKASVDLVGAFTLSVFTVPLLIALSLGRRTVAPGETGYEWGSPQILGMFALSAVGLVAFILAERTVQEPLLDLKLFRNKTFAVGNAAAFISGAVFLGAIVFLPLFMVNVVGLSATSSGFTMTPLTLGIVTGNILSGQLVSRLGRYKVLILSAQAVAVIAFGVMAFTLRPASTQGELTLKMIFVGLGLGPSIPLFTLAIQNAVAPHQVGVATSSATFFRQMGSTIGVALMGTVFGVALSSSMATHMSEATRDVPVEFRRQLLPQQAAGGQVSEEGGPSERSFDAAAIKARIAEGFEKQREALAPAAQAGEPAAKERLAGLAQAQQAAEATVDKVALAFKEAFSEAIRDIYRITMLIALLALLVTLALPELPLRKTNAPAPQVLE
ncbi:MDR family MFS transporter [Archangium lansingense]|uniref:MDR family MFS transporter n=1 Tax=Archangium lansingense TaxID=2995310 RepID=UPI003B80B746